MASPFRSQVHQDPTLFPIAANVLKAKWSPAENGACPGNSYKVTNAQLGTHVIALDKNAAGNWTLRPFVPGSPINDPQMKFLVVDEQLVTWKPYKNGPPSGPVRSDKAGQHGNMYVGRRIETHEIGMMVRSTPQTCEFYTYDNDQHVSEGFEVLCAKPAEPPK